MSTPRAYVVDTGQLPVRRWPMKNSWPARSASKPWPSGS